jgi:hypothetical protein
LFSLSSSSSKVQNPTFEILQPSKNTATEHFLWKESNEFEHREVVGEEKRGSLQNTHGTKSHNRQIKNSPSERREENEYILHLQRMPANPSLSSSYMLSPAYIY